jgi:hypothetical protein
MHLGHLRRPVIESEGEPGSAVEQRLGFSAKIRFSGEVTYPDDVPAHTKVQKLYFGNDFMLRRLDYVTDVLGGVAAHGVCSAALDRAACHSL